jgi:hypothetical protein
MPYQSDDEEKVRAFFDSMGPGNRMDSASDNGSYVKNLPNPVPLAL